MPEGQGSMLKGVGIGAACTVGAAILSLVLVGLPLLVIGILQLAWVLPLHSQFRRKGQPETGKGILLAAGIVFLLNAACWGYFLSGKVRFGG